MIRKKKKIKRMEEEKMVDWMSVWNDYGLLIILGVVFILLGVIHLIKRFNERRKKKLMSERKLETIPEPPKELPAFNLSEYENLLGRSETERENLIEQINIINKKMRRESNDMDRKIREDLARLEANLKEVLKSKQKILEYGKEMSELYKVYEEREKQLGLTMVALNRVLREEEEIKQQ